MKQNSTISETILRGISEGLKRAIPEAALTVSSWAATYRVVSAERVADPALAGKWTNERTPYLVDIMDAVNDPSVNEIVFLKSSQVGGPLCLETPIATTDGWKSMATIAVGDRVFDETGQPCDVVGVSEVFEGHPCFDVVFSDGSVIRCDDRHLWTIRDHHNMNNVVTRTMRTADIANTFKVGNRNSYSIPVASPIKCKETQLIIPPYVLGVWLGDGHSYSNQITQSTADAPETVELIRQCGVEAVLRRPDWCKGDTMNIIVEPSTYAVCSRGHEMTPDNKAKYGGCKKCHSLRTQQSAYGKPMPPKTKPLTFGHKLRQIGVFRNKHIPAEYLRASFADRLALLQGIMDADGSISAKGRCELNLADERLAKDVYELLMTLGIKSTFKRRLETRGFSGNKRKSAPRTHYRMSFLVYSDKPVFRLTRKALKQPNRVGRRTGETESRRIVDVRPVASVPTRCIEVNSPNHLFLAGRSLIATHNTECINNIIGYYMHIDPATILYVCENEGKARAWSTESFAPMLRDSPSLASLMGEAKMRDSSNMIESKHFPGGHFALAWATSPATLSSRPRRVVLTDETDAFEPTKEGDPIGLAEARTKTAGDQRKIIHVTTPRDKETAKCLPLYEKSTAERYFVPCPHCQEFQVLVWANVRWDDDPMFAFYVCEHCGAIIENDDKPEMLAAGQWRSTNPEYTGNRRGFWINELYSPFTSWGDMAVAFLESKNNPAKLRVFTNTRLAEYWIVDGEKIDYADLQFNQEEYSAEVPDGVLLLTAAVDTQDDRLECEVVGWGDDLESWSIDYRVFYGDPGGNAVWDELREYLIGEFTDARGNPFQIKATCIDSGGHHTQAVYKFCKANAGRRFWAIKGSNQPGAPLISRPTANNALRVKLWSIGTEAAKDLVFSCLRVNEPGPGYWHFPNRSPYDEKYFKQLCAEKKIPKFVAGREKYVWVKVSASARNEALDVKVYNLAAYHILNPDLKSFRRSRDRRADGSADPTKNKMPEPDKLPESAPKTAKKPQKTRFIPRKKGGFVRNW